MTIQDALEYDDVLIQPIPSNITSRDDVDISIVVSDTLTLQFPLIASPMVGVVDARFAERLSDLGGLAILHRFYKSRELLFDDIDKYIFFDTKFGISIKVGEDDFEEYFNKAALPSIVLIDTANGYSNALLKYCTVVKNYIVKNNIPCSLMAGNVATRLGADNLYTAGCDIVRVGIGGGANCITRNQTGIGVPTITALMDCSGKFGRYNYKIVADGGIKNSGDFVKSIVAGADFCMAGTLFAECFESPNENRLYGMASRVHQENMNYNIKSVEGIDSEITKKQSLADFVKEFGYGIKSAGTYLDSRSLGQMFENGQFIRVTNSAIKRL